MPDEKRMLLLDDLKADISLNRTTHLKSRVNLFSPKKNKIIVSCLVVLCLQK